MHAIPQPPSLLDSLTDLPRAGVEATRLLRCYNQLQHSLPRGGDQRVVLLPGYGAGDGSMTLLRRLLNRLGHRASSINLGRNVETAAERIRSVDDATAFRSRMVSLIAARLEQDYGAQTEPVTLIGWSMGGCYALDIAREHSGLVERVITLGSPFGDPRGTAMWTLMRRLNNSDAAEEDMDFSGWQARRELGFDSAPVHVIYSMRDGIVASGIARLDEHPAVTHHEVDSSHIGFPFNPNVIDKVAGILASS